MSGSAPTDPAPLDLVASEAGTPIRLHLDERGQAFYSTVLRGDGKLIRVAPVLPQQGNLILERLLGAVRLEVQIAGMPHAANARVMSVSPEAVVLQRQTPFARVQRRRYFRLRADDAVVARVHVDGGGVRNRSVLDISGGGCALRADGDDDLGLDADVPLVQVPLGDAAPFVACAVVRRRIRRDGPVGGEEVLGLEFLGVSARDRYRLVAWITEQERNELKARAVPMAVPDVVALLRDSESHVRLKAGCVLTATGLRFRVFDDEDGFRVGAVHPDVDVRVGGAPVVRTAARVDRVDEGPEGRFVSLTFQDVRIEARLRLQDVLKR